jgi:DNA polymerase I-like protein with 3'-5' exonuclease and polymerase domains
MGQRRTGSSLFPAVPMPDTSPDLHAVLSEMAREINRLRPDWRSSEEFYESRSEISGRLIYGSGGRGLAQSAWNNYGILLTAEEAETARRALLGRYAGLRAWTDVSFVQSNDRGHIRIGRLGRVIEAAWEKPQQSRGLFWYDDEDAGDDDDERYYGSHWRPIRLKRTLCCNAPIQGACADAAMLGLILVDAALQDAGIDGGLVLFIHDELVVEVPEADAARTQAILIKCMTEAFTEAFPGAPVNGLVETKIASSWGPRDDEDSYKEGKPL